MILNILEKNIQVLYTLINLSYVNFFLKHHITEDFQPHYHPDEITMSLTRPNMEILQNDLRFIWKDDGITVCDPKRCKTIVGYFLCSSDRNLWVITEALCIVTDKWTSSKSRIINILTFQIEEHWTEVLNLAPTKIIWFFNLLDQLTIPRRNRSKNLKWHSIEALVSREASPYWKWREIVGRNGLSTRL